MGQAPSRSYPARGEIDHAQAEHQRGQGTLEEAAKAPLPAHRLPGVKKCRLQEVQPEAQDHRRCAPTPHPPKYAKKATEAKARLAKPTSYWNSGLPDSHPRRLASLSWNTKCLKKAKSPTRPTAVGVATAKADAASGNRENPTPNPRMPATSSRMCSTHAITLSHHPLSDTFDEHSDQRTILATKYEVRQPFAPH